MSVKSGQAEKTPEGVTVAQPAAQEVYERLDPTQYQNLEGTKQLEKPSTVKHGTLTQDVQHPNKKANFAFKTEIDGLSQFYDENLYRFITLLKDSLQTEDSERNTANEVEEARKKIQQYTMLKTRIVEKLQAAAKKGARDAANIKEPGKDGKDGKDGKEGRKSVMGASAGLAAPDKRPDGPSEHQPSQKSKSVANKPAVTTEQLVKPGGDVPQPNIEGQAKGSKKSGLGPGANLTKEPAPGLENPGGIPGGKKDDKPEVENFLGEIGNELDPAQPLLEPKVSGDPNAQGVKAKANQPPQGKAKASVDDKSAREKDELRIKDYDKKIKEEEIKIQKSNAKLASGIQKIEFSKNELKAKADQTIEFKKICFSNNGIHGLIITNLGGVIVFETSSATKALDAQTKADIPDGPQASTSFKCFDLLQEVLAKGSNKAESPPYEKQIEAIFSPDDSEIFIYDAYSQVVLTYVLAEVMEHGFQSHPYYENIQKFMKNNHESKGGKPEAIKYQPVQNRKLGEPRFVIPLRYFYEPPKDSSRANSSSQIVFMHFEKIILGEEIFTPVDQDTLILGTDLFVSKIFVPRFNELRTPEPATNKPSKTPEVPAITKGDNSAQNPSSEFERTPVVQLHINKSYSEIFKSLFDTTTEAKKNSEFNYGFGKANLFYTELKVKDRTSSLTIYKMRWDHFTTSQEARLTIKQKGNETPFIAVVKKLQISAQFVLFPNTLSPSGQLIYGYNRSTNEIKSINLHTGEQKKILTIPPNRTGVSHLVVRHQGKFLLVVDNDGYFDIYNNNNGLVDKGSMYSLLANFNGAIDAYVTDQRNNKKSGNQRTHNYKLADLISGGTGIYFINNLNLYYYKLELPVEQQQPAIHKVPMFHDFAIMFRRLDDSYEILQTVESYDIDDHGGEELDYVRSDLPVYEYFDPNRPDRYVMMQRIIDFYHAKNSKEKPYKPVKQRTQSLEYGEAFIDFIDKPIGFVNAYYRGDKNFMESMKMSGTQPKDIIERFADFLQGDCGQLPLSLEYQVNVKKSKLDKEKDANFKLIIHFCPFDNEQAYRIVRVNESNSAALNLRDKIVWELQTDTRPDLFERSLKLKQLFQKPDANKPVKNPDLEAESDAESEYEDEEEPYFQPDSGYDRGHWNRTQRMHNQVPISDDGSMFLVPGFRYLIVYPTTVKSQSAQAAQAGQAGQAAQTAQAGNQNTKEAKDQKPKPTPIKCLPLLKEYGSVFWLNESKVGAVLTQDVKLTNNRYEEWFGTTKELKKGILVFTVTTKADDEDDDKFKQIPFKVRVQGNEELLNYDLKTAQFYPSGFKDLRWVFVWDEVLAFDTNRLTFLLNAADLREKQAIATLMKSPQFLPSYVFKSCSYQTSPNNNFMALAPIENATFVRLFKLPKLEFLDEIKLVQGAANLPVRMCFSHDSKYFLVMTSNLQVNVYSLVLEKEVEAISLAKINFKGAIVTDINLVENSKYLEVLISSKNQYLIHRLPFYPESRDLMLGALSTYFRRHSKAADPVEKRRLAKDVAALARLQYLHQVCLDSTLLKILCCHNSKEPLEDYLDSLPEKEIVFKVAQLDILTSIHESAQTIERDYLGLSKSKTVMDSSMTGPDSKAPGSVSIDLQSQAKKTQTNHVLNTFIEAMSKVQEDQKKLPDISAKTIISWMQSKSLSRRYRTKLIELVTFEPLNNMARGALKSETGMVALIPEKATIEKTVAFINEYSKPLMDDESANISEFDAYVTGIDFDLRNGSEFSLNYFEHLQEVSDEDLQLKYMGIIYYKWSQILYPATLYSLLYWALNILITAFMGFMYNQPNNYGLGWTIIILNVIFISYELKGISYDLSTSWKDPWNYYDTVTHAFTMISVMIFFKNPNPGYDLNWLRIVSFVLISFRGVMMLRIFAGTRYLLVMMLEVFNDMVAFLSIFFWMTFAYWFMCLTRPSLTEGGQDLELLAAIGQALDIAFSNFNAGGLPTITLVTTIIGQVMIALILLNYLISIVSKTSERISEQRELYDIKMLLEIIREFDLVFSGFRSSKEARNVRYLILRPRPNVDEEVKEVLALFEEEKAKLEQAVKAEVANLEAMVVEKIEIYDTTITETQKTVLDLVRKVTQRQFEDFEMRMGTLAEKIEKYPQLIKDVASKAQSGEKSPVGSGGETEHTDDGEGESANELYYHESADSADSSGEGESVAELEDAQDEEDQEARDEENDDEDY